MQYRNLGKTGIETSVIGLGTYPIGGWMWGGTDEADSIRTIQACLEMGINLIDTAPMYGYGLAEEIVGKAIKGRRDKAIVATKCGVVWDTEDWPTGKGEFHFYADDKGLTAQKTKYSFYRYLKPESIIREVETSLKRLGTDYIDLLQTHAQENTTPIEETMTALEKLREQGKIRAIGCSNVTKEQLTRYCGAGTLDSTQERYSYLDRLSEENGVLGACRTNQVSFIAYSPLEHGLLTGTLDPNFDYPDGDFRKTDKRFSRDNVDKTNKMLAKLQPLADRHSFSISQLMLAWTVSKYEKLHIICGMRNVREVTENAQAGKVLLATEEIQEIEATVDRSLFDAEVPQVAHSS